MLQRWQNAAIKTLKRVIKPYWPNPKVTLSHGKGQDNHLYCVTNNLVDLVRFYNPLSGLGWSYPF